MKLYQRKDRIRYWIGIVTVITMAVLGILFAVKMKLGKAVTVTLKTGRYVAEDGMSWLVIEEEEQFYLVQNIAVSYAPRGNYIIDEDKLILQVNRDLANTVVFKIQGDQLIFESGDMMDDFIKKDRVFIYDSEGTFNKSFGLQQFEEAMKEKKYDFEMTDAE